MSIEESLTSLRHLISSVAPVHDQLRAIDAVISAYKGESDALTKVQEKYSILATEHEKFKSGASAEIAALKAENAKLKPNPGDSLDEVCNKMLVFLANFKGHDGITDGELIRHLGIPKAKGDFLFAQLRQRHFVGDAGGQMNRGTFWFVTDAGLEYLNRHGLL